MKLASLRSQKHRDGILCLVNQELTRYVPIPDCAANLQEALEHWDGLYPVLQKKALALNEGLIAEAKLFDPKLMASPLPRAYQWADGSAYLNHVALVRQARGAEMPEHFLEDPLMYQGGSDAFLSPTEPIAVASEDYGIDFEAEIAIITDDVPMGISVEKASKHIKLILLVNDVSLRHLIPDELAKNFGFFQSKPSSSFSPIALTPDELGAQWDGQRADICIRSTLNGQIVGELNAGSEMHFSFPELIAHAAKTRPLSAGTIIGSGTVSNQDETKGYSCIAEKRMREIIHSGKATTPFMHFGDTIRIEALDAKGNSIFGAIDQKVIRYQGAS